MARFAAWVAVLIAVLVAGAARAVDCPLPPEAIEVRLELAEGDVRHDNSLPSARIAAIAGLPSASAPQAAGLTRSAYQQSLDVGVRTIETAPGRVCARVTRVEARIGFTRFDVHVAREYPPGTCKHAQILEHELRHVAIGRGVLRRHARAFEDALRTEAGRIGVLRAGGADEAASVAADRIGRRMAPVFDAFGKAMKAENAAFDSPAEYRRISQACPNG